MPSFLAVSANVPKVSQDFTPSSVRGPKLTSRFRTRCLTPSSEALLWSIRENLGYINRTQPVASGGLGFPTEPMPASN